MFNLTNALQKYHIRSSITALILLLVVSCAQPPSGIPTQAELGTAFLNFQILPAEVGSVDVELIPSNPTIAKGVNQELYRKTMVIPEGLAQLAARPTQLQFQNIPIGSYKAKVQAHMRYQATTLYTAANAVEVRKISTQGVIAPGAKTETTAIPVQTIALERAQGEVKVQVNQPSIANLPTLVYTAQVGSFRTPLTLKDGVLSGTITGIPTAPGHILLVEGRDAAGTLMLQGNKRVDVDRATTQQTVELQQIAFGHREPENPDVQNLASTNVTESFKIKVNTSCGECMGDLTHLVVHWGDGNTQYMVAQNGVLPTDLDHVYSNAGAQVLSITAFDRAGVAAQTSKLVTTNDPKIQLAHPGSICCQQCTCKRPKTKSETDSHDTTPKCRRARSTNHH
jgi:hypothetical protein